MNVIIACIGCYVLGICSLIIYEEIRDWCRASRQIRQEQTTYTSGAAYDACEDDEPKRATNISAIHCMDQIDALLERL